MGESRTNNAGFCGDGVCTAVLARCGDAGVAGTVAPADFVPTGTAAPEVTVPAGVKAGLDADAGGGTRTVRFGGDGGVTSPKTDGSGGVGAFDSSGGRATARGGGPLCPIGFDVNGITLYTTDN